MTKAKSSLPSVWSSFKNSFYNPEFYKQVPRFPFGKVMAHLLLIVTLSYFAFLGFGAAELWQNREKIEQGFQNALAAFPQDMQLTFKDGVMSSNVEEPFYFPKEGVRAYFQDKEDLKVESDAPQYFVVIDTHTPFSVDQFQTYDSAVWLGSDATYVKGDTGQIQTFPYGKDMNQVVDRDSIGTFAKEFLAKIKTPLIVMGSVLLVMGDVLFFVYYFAYLAFAALLYFIVSQSAGNKHEYPDCYRIVTYALTPAWLLSLLIQMLNLALPLAMPPFLFTAVLLFTVYFNVHHKDAKLKA